MTDSTQQQAPPPAAKPEQKKIPGLAPGRIITYCDPFGVPKVAIITDVLTEDGEVALVEFGRHHGDEPTRLMIGVRYSESGVSSTWKFPEKK